MPAFENVLASDDGYLLLLQPADADASTRLWDVFGPGYRYLGTLEVPHHFSPRQVGRDFVLGTWKDELDIESVRIYGLVRP
jgi:hypothetical protein